MSVWSGGPLEVQLAVARLVRQWVERNPRYFRQLLSLDVVLDAMRVHLPYIDIVANLETQQDHQLERQQTDATNPLGAGVVIDYFEKSGQDAVSAPPNMQRMCTQLWNMRRLRKSWLV